MSWSGFMNFRQNGSGLSLGKISKQQWMVFLLAGVLLAVIALPVKDSGAKDSKEATGALDFGQETAGTPKEQMERQMEELLSRTEGVGQVKVLLSLKEGESVDFYGEESFPKVEGVLIAAEGAGNSIVERNIQQAVMALFSVEAHKIKIMKMI